MRWLNAKYGYLVVLVAKAVARVVEPNVVALSHTTKNSSKSGTNVNVKDVDASVLNLHQCIFALTKVPTTWRKHFMEDDITEAINRYYKFVINSGRPLR